MSRRIIAAFLLGAVGQAIGFELPRIWHWPDWAVIVWFAVTVVLGSFCLVAVMYLRRPLRID